MADSRFPQLLSKTYRTVSRIRGPLLFVERTTEVAYDELVTIKAPDGEERLGRVLEVDGALALVQVFAGTRALNLSATTIEFTGDVARLDVSPELLGRSLDALGRPLDGGPPIQPDESRDMNGVPLNPSVRLPPSAFVETGISAIDGLNVLTRGQKLPIFSGAGLPANRLAAQIAAQVDVAGEDVGDFAVVFAAMGVTHREVDFFETQFRERGALERAVLFLNRADDPSMLRLLAPRAALTAAEYLAYTEGRHVLVIMTDMTNYCEALREVASAREEIPGRRGYPGYMYSDLASLYERAGRIKGSEGTVTQLIILSMPDDDITHPIPDLTGYITEGQIVLDRELHRQGIYPPVAILPSLSRQMDAGIGPDQTRADHRAVANQLYALYAEGDNLRRLVAIIGEEALSDEEQQVLAFADDFERTFLDQGDARRDIDETLNIAWGLLSQLPSRLLKRIPDDVLAQSHSPEGRDGNAA